MLESLIANLRLTKYQNDPVGFAHDILKVKPWAKQIEIMEAVVKYRKVMVVSANSIGKSWILAVLLLWHHCTRTKGLTLFTAPAFRQVEAVVMRQVRQLIQQAGLKINGLLPKDTKIDDTPEHYMLGFTASTPDAFQGWHNAQIFLAFEEFIGVDQSIWDAARGVLQGGDNYFLAIGNPTDLTSQGYLEYTSGRWHIISISFKDHPNIKAELEGKEQIIPGACCLKEVKENIEAWCEETFNPTATDFEFDGKWYTPSPAGMARLLGKWPDQDFYGLFSINDWKKDSPYLDGPIVIGVDCAFDGLDFTCIHIRKGNKSIYHESYNGKDELYTANRLKTLCHEYGCPGQYPDKIPCVIDSIGFGSGVISHRNEYNFIGVKSSKKAASEQYHNVRTELLFRLRNKLRNGLANTSQLPQNVLNELIRQSLTITYRPNNKGMPRALEKEKIKQEIGRSPDDIDAVALAYYHDDVSFKSHFIPHSHRSNHPFKTISNQGRERDDTDLIQFLENSRKQQKMLLRKQRE